MSASNPVQPRVCVLIESYFPVVGGMESQARTLASILTERGVPLLFITRRTSPELAPFEAVDGVPVWRVGPAGRSSRLRWAMALTCLPALVRRRHEYDMIFVPGLRALGLTAVLAARLLGKRCILKGESCGELSGAFFATGLRDLRLRVSSRPVRWLLALRNRLLARADAFVSMSTELTAEFTSQGVSPDIIHLIPQTVDVGRFQPVSPDRKRELRQALSLPAERTLAIYTGRLVSYKGIPLLLDVWNELSRGRNDLALVIVGAGGVDVYNCEAALKDFAGAHEMQDRVIFTGAVRNVNEYLQASDIFAFPTENEAFGISLIEAMACALPVISTAIGGIKDIISPDRNGLMIEAGNRVQLRAALARLLDDPGLCAQLGRAALQTVRERYTRDIVAGQYTDLFAHLMPGSTERE